MNKTLTFILLFTFFKISAQSDKPIIKGIWREYSKSDGLCSVSLKLYNDSSYFFESGCEERSKVNIGRWILRNDTIQLIPIDTAIFNAVSFVTKDKRGSQDSLFIKIIDINDQPVPEFDLILVSPNIDYKLINYPGGYVFSDENKSDIVLHSIQTDLNGIVSVLCNEKGSFMLLDIKQIFGKNILISYERLITNYICIKLNVKKDLFFYPVLKWVNLKYVKIENNPNELKFIKD